MAKSESSAKENNIFFNGQDVGPRSNQESSRYDYLTEGAFFDAQDYLGDGQYSYVMPQGG